MRSSDRRRVLVAANHALTDCCDVVFIAHMQGYFILNSFFNTSRP